MYIILIVLLVLFLLGGIPVGGPAFHYWGTGAWGGGGIGLILVILLVLLLAGRL